MTRLVWATGIGFLSGYAIVSLATGQRSTWLGDVAQLVPPLGYAALTLSLARMCSGQVRVFWNLNAIHAIMWALGQAIWTYYDVALAGVPIISPTDPIFFVSSIPLAAALYGRPERDRPRWLFDIVLLDIVLIALFGVFAYVYFIGSLMVTGGPEEVYDAHLTQLFNVRNLLLAGWAAWVWQTATSPAWRRMLGLYCAGLSLTFAGGIVYDAAVTYDRYATGSLWDLVWMAPYVVLGVAAAEAYDDRLFTSAEPAPPVSRLPVVSLIAIALLVLIPITDEIARAVLTVPAATQMLRTRIALGMMIPFGLVVVVREFLSRRALVRAARDVLITREQLAEKEKLAAVGEMVSGVALELNNPLQGVLGYAELLSQAQNGEPESEELRAIRENASRAAGIVRNLLSAAGRETSSQSWQQVNRIVLDAVAARAPFLHTAGIEMHLQLSERLPLIYLDPTPFERVITSLIQNAEVSIGKSRSAPRRALDPGVIIVASRREAGPDRIVIEIADNGVGVQTEDLAELFNPTFAAKPAEHGIPFDLSACHLIVRVQGGLLRARNRDTGGASFVLELPVTADAYPTDEPPLPEREVEADESRMPLVSDVAVSPRVSRKPKALVVDDEDSNAVLVRRALDRAGYEVESTTLSRRALVMIERTSYDVVIADVKMPELNGQELYSRVCQIRPEMARRFIFVTGDIDGEDTMRFLTESRCGYFMKPFNLEQLTAAADMLVGGRSDEDTLIG